MNIDTAHREHREHSHYTLDIDNINTCHNEHWHCAHTENIETKNSEHSEEVINTV